MREQAGAVHGKPRSHQRTQFVAREYRHRTTFAGTCQRLRMLGIGGRENVRSGPGNDVLVQQPRGAEFRFDLTAVRSLEGLATSVSAALRLPAA